MPLKANKPTKHSPSNTTRFRSLFCLQKNTHYSFFDTYIKYLLDRLIAIPRRERHWVPWNVEYGENRLLLAIWDHVLRHRPLKRTRPLPDYFAIVAMCSGVGYVLLLMALLIFYYFYTNRWFTLDIMREKTSFGVDVVLVKKHGDDR